MKLFRSRPRLLTQLADDELQALLHDHTETLQQLQRAQHHARSRHRLGLGLSAVTGMGAGGLWTAAWLGLLAPNGALPWAAAGGALATVVATLLNHVHARYVDDDARVELQTLVRIQQETWRRGQSPEVSDILDAAVTAASPRPTPARPGLRLV